MTKTKKVLGLEKVLSIARQLIPEMDIEIKRDGDGYQIRTEDFLGFSDLETLIKLVAPDDSLNLQFREGAIIIEANEQ